MNSEEFEKIRVTNFFMWPLIGLLVLLIASVLILSLVPPVSKDALVHHLGVPKLYLKHGRMYEIPFMPFSYYPMNLDLLYLIPLYFGNDIIPKFIHFAFALLTAWLIFAYLKRRTNRIYALFGVIFFLSIPIIVKLSITVYVDLGLIFFSTASLLLLLQWIESRYRLGILILSAISCGLAMGTKYNGLITFLLLTLFVPFVYSRYTQDKKLGFFRSVGYGIIFAAIAVLVFSPWIIRNYLWINNPIFPLYDHLFNPQSGEAQEATSLFTFRERVYHESFWEMALLPIRVFFQGQDGSPRYFDGKLNPFLFIFPFFAFYQIEKSSSTLQIEKKMLLTFTVLFFSFAFFSSDLRIRYISPIIPPLVLLSVYGVKNVFDFLRRIDSQWPRRMGIILTLGVASFSLWLNAIYVYRQYQEVDPFSFLSGAVSRDEYIDRYRYEYPVMRYINENLSEDATILFVFVGKRGYYCNRNYVLDQGTLYKIVKESQSPEEILAKLQSMGITHLLIRYDIFDKWKEDRGIFDENELHRLQEFMVKYNKVLFYKWSYGISRLENTRP